MIKISIPEKVNEIICTLAAAGREAYVVGGCVRDALLGRKPADWDVTTSALPAEVKALFGRTIDTGLKHGTVTVMRGNEGFEVTTYRVDGEYEDCRHPREVRFTRSLSEDLKRRDFTINAMAYNDAEGLIDEFDGLGDLRRGVIRCVGRAEERFTEDALRMMRAVRFSAQLGFIMETQTRAAIGKLCRKLRNVSAERIQAELVKLLCSPHPETLRDAWETGITGVVLPEFDVCMACAQRNPHHIYSVGEHTLHALEQVEADRILRLAVLLHDFGKPAVKTTDEAGVDHFKGHQNVGEELAGAVLRRLKFDNETIRQVKKLVFWHDWHPTPTQANVRRAASRIGAELFPACLKVQRADILAQNPALQGSKLERLDEVERLYRRILEEKNCFTLEQLAADGRDLMKAGIPSGPQIGESLKYLLELVLEDPRRNEKELLIGEAVRKYREDAGSRSAEG